MAAGLGLFWFARGYWAEGREYVARLRSLAGGGRKLAIGPPAPVDGPHAPGTLNPSLAAAQARALAWTGLLAGLQGEPEAGRALGEESVSIARELGDRTVLAETLFMLAERIRATGGDLEQGRSLLEESLRL